MIERLLERKDHVLLEVAQEASKTEPQNDSYANCRGFWQPNARIRAFLSCCSGHKKTLLII
jgi:hypothetical protein